jgi:hypothetical protein
MGILVNLVEWKKKREDEALAKELSEIAELREEVKRLMTDIGDAETGPYQSTEEGRDWMLKMTNFMLTSLDGYSNWPIDSSDL